MRKGERQKEKDSVTQWQNNTKRKRVRQSDRIRRRERQKGKTM
jgi:hypothetical protein